MGELDFKAHDGGIQEMRSVTLHVSVNWHPNTSLSTLEQGLADNGPENNFSVTQIQSLFATLLIFVFNLIWQSQNPLSSKREIQDHPLEALNTRLMKDQKKLPPFLP